MTSITFDTHAYIKKLKDKGFTEVQAESVVDMVNEVRAIDLASLATKADLQMLELRLKVQIGTMIFALGGVLLAVKFFGHG